MATNAASWKISEQFEIACGGGHITVTDEGWEILLWGNIPKERDVYLHLHGADLPALKQCWQQWCPPPMQHCRNEVVRLIERFESKIPKLPAAGTG